tara:strand:- start:197625 stop:198893 length:1269 start_codon:yes stop_codon:yes gene_type:complete
MRKQIILYLTTALLLGNALFSQTDSSKVLGPEILTRSPLGLKVRPYLEYQGQISFESSNLSTGLLLRLRTATTYDDAIKNDILGSLDNGLRIGILQNNEIRFAYKGHKKRHLRPYARQSIALFLRNQTSLAASKDLVNLVLSGNKSTAGIVQDLSDFDYEDWLYSGLQLQFSFLIDTLPVSIGAGLIVGHRHQSISTGKATLFTAENGTEISFDGSLDYNAVSRPFAYGIAGVGLGFDLMTEERWGKHQLKLAAQDLGFLTFSDGAGLKVDSSFSFTGINIANIFAVEEGFLESSLDSTQNVLGEPSTMNYTRLLPFMLQLEYEYLISRSSLKSLYLQGRYRYLPSYLPRVELGARWELRENMHLNTGFNLGGFNNWGISTEYFWQIKTLWQLGLGVSHINTLAIQGLSGGSSAFFSLRYYL